MRGGQGRGVGHRRPYRDLVGGYPSPAAIRARPRGFALLDDIPGVRRHVLAYLARDLRDQQDELVRASFADVTTRVAAWLARAAGRSGTTVVLPGAQHGLAEAIGATRVSVNRALRTLAAEGLVRVGPGVVTILAPELLAHRAGTDVVT